MKHIDRWPQSITTVLKAWHEAELSIKLTFPEGTTLEEMQAYLERFNDLLVETAALEGWSR